MGYLGSKLEDYWPHQLIEEVNRQMKQMAKDIDIEYLVNFSIEITKLSSTLEQIFNKSLDSFIVKNNKL